MKRKIIAVALFVVMGLTGWYFLYHDDAAAQAGAQAQVRVERMDIEDVVTALGKLEPANYVDVGAQISGQLLKLHVELGSVVNRGDLLAEIDPRTHETRIEADRANLAQLEAAQAERRANLLQAERNWKRDAELLRQKATSQLNAQSSETEYKVAQAQVQAIEAQIQQARASLATDELNLSYCRIYAPISGTVVSLPVKEGQTINSSQTAPTLMRVADLEVMTVWASVSEADINKLDPGMDVYFTTIGDTATRYYAKLDKVHPSYVEENDVILYDVVFNVENPNHVFLPAMNTQVFFVLAQAEDTLGLPLDALPDNLRSAGEAVLGVLNPDGREEQRAVTFGVRTRTAVQVLDGLEEGEIVLAAFESSGAGQAANGAGRAVNSARRMMGGSSLGRI
ncbi:MAG: efflux RND transporter periplasmic adaptor subunit [Deltaproteobacteria bacterium]|jgi:macrolide-specific efflux system membrane fusion protein|nr:efflux RND transporter periplasmic adaptor subunit [Deltaproteobacteria bacterium]